MTRLSLIGFSTALLLSFTPLTHAAPSGGIACTILSSPVTLRLGVTNPNVLYLQKLLNLDPATQVSSSGPGSPGQETTRYGPRTAQAVKRLQEKYRSDILTPSSLSKGTGFAGPATRKKLLFLYCSTPPPPTATTTPPLPPDPSGATGSITLDSPCTIGKGYNSCLSSISWTTTNATTPTLTKEGTVIAQTPTGSLTLSLPYGPTTLTLSNGSYTLATKTLTPSCIEGTTWNGVACVAEVVPPISGSCGSSHGQSFTTPPTTSLCSTGTASSVLTNPSTYTWSCVGSEGGTTASCSSQRISPVADYTSPFVGKAFYVDSATGNDTNPGTKESPWKTLTKASTATLAAGNGLLLKCGSTWRESLTIGSTFAPQGGIIGAYGPCSNTVRPVLSGADVVNSSWTQDIANPNVYVTTLGSDIRDVYWNGEMLFKARQPNYGGIGDEYNLVSAISADTPNSFAVNGEDKTFFSGKDLVGAVLHIRAAPWWTDERDISAYNPTTGFATFVKKPGSSGTDVPTVPVAVGVGYILEGKKWMLDSQKEWYYDSSTKKLYVWLPGGSNPSTGLLEVTRRDKGLIVGTYPAIPNVNDIKIEKLLLEHHAVAGVEVNGGNNITLSDIVAKGNYQGAVFLAGDNNTIENSYISGSDNLGIMARTNSPYVTIKNNTVIDTGMLGAHPRTIASVYCADAKGCKILNNTIINSGYIGIDLYATSSNVLIEGNYVEKTCQRFGDCGAIYTSMGGDPLGRVVIRSNFLTDTGYNTDGLVGTNYAYGIYLDTIRSYVDVIGNLISKTDGGYMVHCGSYNTVKDNIIWLQKIRGGVFQDACEGSVFTQRGNVLSNNYVFITDKAVPQVSFWNLGAQTMNEFITGTNPNVINSNSVIPTIDSALLKWAMYIKGKSIYPDNLTEWKKIEPTLRILSPTTAYGEIDLMGIRAEWVNKLKTEVGMSSPLPLGAVGSLSTLFPLATKFWYVFFGAFFVVMLGMLLYIGHRNFFRKDL